MEHAAAEEAVFHAPVIWEMLSLWCSLSGMNVNVSDCKLRGVDWSLGVQS
jgi:hypothetical protein